MKTRFIIFTILALINGSGMAFTKKVWDPSTATSDAKSLFEKSGYTPMTVTDGKGNQYHGEKELDQDIIFCAIDGIDMKLYVYKVQSLDEKNIRSYVTTHNTEMLRLQARRRGCLR